MYRDDQDAVDSYEDVHRWKNGPRFQSHGDNLAQRHRHGEAWKGLTEQPATMNGWPWWVLILVGLVVIGACVARCAS